MKTLSRISWLLALAALLAGRLGWGPGPLLAVAIAALHAAALAAVFGRQALVAIQMRALFSLMALLGLALWPPLHWLQIAALSGMLLFDYCLAGRLLLLLPWNRSAPFSLGLVRRMLFTYPLPTAFDGPTE